ncbi:hypothetical protein GCM10025734_29110 [Kitasatospora paranensis]
MTSGAAAALLARGDPAGPRAVLAARADTTAQGTADQLGAELDGDPRWMTGDGVTALFRQLQVLAADADPRVRDEAQRRLSLLARTADLWRPIVTVANCRRSTFSGTRSRFAGTGHGPRVVNRPTVDERQSPIYRRVIEMLR